MTKKATKELINLVEGLRGKLNKAIEAHGGIVPTTTLFDNRSVLASFLDEDKTISELIREISITDFHHSVVRDDENTITLHTTLSCGDLKCDLDLGQPKVNTYFKEHSKKLTWLLKECELDKFIGKFFEFIIIEGFVKYDFASWNCIKIRKFLKDCKDLVKTRISKDSDNKCEIQNNNTEEKEMKNLEKLGQDQRMMEALGAVIGGMVKGQGRIHLRGTIGIKVDIDAERSREKNGERKIVDSMKVKAGVEVGLDIQFNGEFEGDVNGNVKAETH